MRGEKKKVENHEKSACEKRGEKRKLDNQEKPNFEKRNGKKFKTTDKQSNKVKNVKNKDFKKDLPKTNANDNEKPNWVELKKEQKKLKLKRKASKLQDSYETFTQAKQIGELLRNKKLSEDQKVKLTKKFHDLVKTKYAKTIFTHDMSRVIQWQVEHCNRDMRLEIAQELKPNISEMFLSKYAKNIVRRFIKRGDSSIKRIIIEACYGNVVKLISSVISASLFETIFVQIASDDDKCKFKQELYGDLYKSSKDPNVKSLVDVFKSCPNMKSSTLTAVKANLTKILNKNLINSTLVHTVLYEYLQICSKEDQEEMIALIKELIAELTQSWDGTKAAMIAFWHGTNKDRKVMLKSMKEHVNSIILSEYGYAIILTIFDCVDDTVLIKKIILDKIIENFAETAKNEHGKKVIQYLVARRDPKYFHPELIALLKQGDENESSKKPADIREKELLNSVIGAFINNISTDIQSWLSSGSTQLLTLAILNASSGEVLGNVFTSIANFIINEDSVIKKESKEFKAIEEPGLHMILKKLLQNDKKRIESNDVKFGSILSNYLTEGVIRYWIKYNRGCFILLNLLETQEELIINKIKEIMYNFKNVLKGEKSAGAKLLLRNLGENN